MSFSVLMSVYIKEKPDQFRACLQSLLEQTLRADEVVLVEDGPISAPLQELIEDYREPLRIRSVTLEVNQGLAKALNRGLLACSNELVARMDTDDICLPGRFFEQYNFLSTRDDISVLGAQIEEFDPQGVLDAKTRIVPVNHDDIVEFSLSRNPISHPVVFFRKSAVLEVGGYPELYPEDHLLWLMMLDKGFRFHNLDQCLLKMRVGRDFIQRRGLLFARGEIRVLWWLFSKSKIGLLKLVTGVFGRLILRALPGNIKLLAYKHLR